MGDYKLYVCRCDRLKVVEKEGIVSIRLPRDAVDLSIPKRRYRTRRLMEDNDIHRLID